MRKKLCLLVMMMSVFTLSAQMYVTPEAGIAAYRDNGSFNRSWNAGLKAGVAVEYRFRPGVFSLQSGAYYMNNSTFSQTTEMSVDNGQLTVMGGNVNSHYLQIPLLAKFNMKLNGNTGISVAFGPYVGIPLSTSYDYSSVAVKYSDVLSGTYWIAPYDCSGSYQGGYGYGAGGYGYGDGGPYGYWGGYTGLNMNAIGGDEPVVKSNYWKSKYRPEGLIGGLMFQLGLDVDNFVIGLAYDLNFADKTTWNGNRTFVDLHTVSLSLGYKFKIF